MISACLRFNGHTNHPCRNAIVSTALAFVPLIVGLILYYNLANKVSSQANKAFTQVSA